MCLLHGTDWVFIYNSTFCPHGAFMCFVWIWEQTAIISLYNINWLVFISERECVHCAVRTEYLYITKFNHSLLRVNIQPPRICACICFVRLSNRTATSSPCGVKRRLFWLYGSCRRQDSHRAHSTAQGRTQVLKFPWDTQPFPQPRLQDDWTYSASELR